MRGRSEIVLVEAERVLGNLAELWRDATAAERAELMGATFSEVRVRDKEIVSVTMAEPEYAALVASSEARRLRLVGPDTTSDEPVAMAPPDGSKGAWPTFAIDAVPDLVEQLLAA